MVQLFYYETLGRRCDKLIRINGRRMSLELYAFESVPSTSMCNRWELRFPWFTYRYCSVVKVSQRLLMHVLSCHIPSGSGILTVCITYLSRYQS